MPGKEGTKGTPRAPGPTAEERTGERSTQTYPQQTAGEAASGADEDTGPEVDHERLRRRARFLRELNEAKELRERVQPRRARVARKRHQMRMRTFRW